MSIIRSLSYFDHKTLVNYIPYLLKPSIKCAFIDQPQLIQ